MAVSYDFEFTSPVSPARMFKASILDIHNLAPKIMPDIVASSSLLQGDGGVGSVKQFRFPEGRPYTHGNQRVDYIDEDKFEYKGTVIDGVSVGTRLVSVVYYVKFEPTSSGGCICKVTGEHYPMSGVEYTEQDLKVGKEANIRLYKCVEEYLIKNSEAYA